MEHIRTFSTPSHPAQIDADKCIILGCSIVVAGEAAGHQLIFAQTSLRQLMEIGNQRASSSQPTP